MAVRIGFIGSGGIANHHMRNLATNSAAEMVAFSDPDVERARAAAKQYGGTAYKSYRTMLKRVDLDAAFICTPPFAHTDQENSRSKPVARFSSKNRSASTSSASKQMPN